MPPLAAVANALRIPFAYSPEKEKLLEPLIDRFGEQGRYDRFDLIKLRRWSAGRVAIIGDAAHAMSPVGGVGINLAIQDAVAAANLLWQPLKDGTLREEDLEGVQRRREFPTRVTQRLQVIVQNNVIDRLLGAGESLRTATVNPTTRASKPTVTSTS